MAHLAFAMPTADFGVNMVADVDLLTVFVLLGHSFVRLIVSLTDTLIKFNFVFDA